MVNLFHIIRFLQVISDDAIDLISWICRIFWCSDSYLGTYVTS